jgi:hypothetical protein
MLEYKDESEEGDDYVVEGRDPEEDEDKKESKYEEESDEVFATWDPESTLLWWRGAPYHKTVTESSGPKVDEDFEVLDESIKIIEGTWRRMFEVDMREDENDFNSKAMEAEMKELEEEIGELGGMDDDMVDCVGFGSSSHSQRVGSFVSMTSLPAEWKEEMEFFKELDTTDVAKISGLRAGKKAEQAEFEALLKEVELELEQV